MADEEDIEKREERRRATRIASIVTGGSAFPIPCVVLDLSPSGARLHLHEPAEVPDVFELLMIAEDTRHSCEARWRNGNEIGVRFLD